MAVKGNIIIGQSGGPTAVINSSLAGAIKAAREAGVRKIYGMHYGIEGFLQEDILDLKQIVKNDEDISLLMRTPSAFLGSCRYKLPAIDGNEDVYEKIFSILEKNDISQNIEVIISTRSMGIIDNFDVFKTENDLIFSLILEI